jgi:hypothetical protein
VRRTRVKRTSLVLGALGLAALLGAFPGSSAGSSSKPPWGASIEVPGTAALNVGGDAWVESVSCGAVGVCVAGGRYLDGSVHAQAFVATERKGAWGAAVQVPGVAALNLGGDARVQGVSCGSAGECAAVGYYRDGSGHDQVFVVSEKRGVWGSAVEVPGTAALDVGGYARFFGVSCGAVGDCAAGGFYTDGAGSQQAFLVREKTGVWGSAVEVPGTAALNAGGLAEVIGVSCAAAGECAAGGFYTDGSGSHQAFVVSEKKGVWGSAVEVPGTAALNAGGLAGVSAVSCGAAGDCATGGFFFDGSHQSQAFVATEKKGVWGAAVELPGTAALNAGGNAEVNLVSCGAAGDCAAGGYYKDGSGQYPLFLASEKKGVWGAAAAIPGMAALNVGNNDELAALSCGAAGDCAAGGEYQDGAGDIQAFVANETKGAWRAAVELTGTAALGGGAEVYALSCVAVGECAAGGGYTDGSLHGQAFVADLAVPCVVPHVVGKTLSAAENALSLASCAVGKIKKVKAKAKAGRVVAQSPKPGKHLKGGSKVALSLSKGRK